MKITSTTPGFYSVSIDTTGLRIIRDALASQPPAARIARCLAEQIEAALLPAHRVPVSAQSAPPPVNGVDAVKAVVDTLLHTMQHGNEIERLRACEAMISLIALGKTIA